MLQPTTMIPDYYVLSYLSKWERDHNCSLWLLQERLAPSSLNYVCILMDSQFLQRSIEAWTHLAFILSKSVDKFPNFPTEKMILSVINSMIHEEISQRRLNNQERLWWKSTMTIHFTSRNRSMVENQLARINGAEKLSGGIKENMEIVTLHPTSLVQKWELQKEICGNTYFEATSHIPHVERRVAEIEIVKPHPAYHIPQVGERKLRKGNSTC